MFSPATALNDDEFTIALNVLSYGITSDESCRNAHSTSNSNARRA